MPETRPNLVFDCVEISRLRIALCMVAGVLLGKLLPSVTAALRGRRLPFLHQPQPCR